MSDDELTPSEREAFASLSREKTPSDVLEERTVRALREDGTLRDATVPPRARWTARRLAVVAAACAACLALFAGGFAAGRWSGRPTPAGPDGSAALTIQEAATSYLSALDALAGPGSRDAQAREVALNTLFAVADRTADAMSGTPAAERIRSALGAAADTTGTRASLAQGGRVIWF